jgi:PST family polysaccharide transporter
VRAIINFFSKIGVDSVSRLIGFATLPFITRILGPEGYGMYSYLFVIVSYYGFFIDFGYLNYGTNKLCEKENPEDVVGRILSLQILTAGISFVVIVVSGVFFLEREMFLYVLLFSLIFIPQIIAIKYYYLAANKLYFNSMAELSGQIIYAALVFTVFAVKPDISTLIIIAVVQALATGLVLFVPFARSHNIKIDFRLKKNIETVKEAYKLGLSSKAEGITSSFIILMTGTLLNGHSVGLYNASYKIYLILLTVIQGLSYAMMPVLLKSVKADGNRHRNVSLTFYMFLTVGLLLGISTFVLSDKIIMLMFGKEFMESVSILRWFSVTIAIWPVLMFVSLILLARNKFGYLLTLSLISMSASVVFSIVLIKFYEITGSALVMPAVAVVSTIAGIILLHRSSERTDMSLKSIISPSCFYSDLKENYARIKAR